MFQLVMAIKSKMLSTIISSKEAEESIKEGEKVSKEGKIVKDLSDKGVGEIL